jgi:hypothetical protein
MTTTRPAPAPAGLVPAAAWETNRHRPGTMITVPPPGDAARLAGFLAEHPSWSVFWDKRQCVWRAAEDDPDSALYAESRDLDTVLGYITAHS